MNRANMQEMTAIAEAFNIPPPMSPEQEQALEDEERRRAEAVEADARRRREERFEARIPKSYRDNRLDAPELTQRVKPATAIAEGRAAMGAPWVTFVGPPGSGKTSLAVAMLFAAFAADSSFAPRFVHAYRLGVARIQSKAGEGECEEVWAAMVAPLLLIDDMGSERDTANNAISDVIQERHAEGRPTWVTTGLSAEEVAKRYSGGCARRMFELATVIKLGRAR